MWLPIHVLISIKRCWEKGRKILIYVTFVFVTGWLIEKILTYNPVTWEDISDPGDKCAISRCLKKVEGQTQLSDNWRHMRSINARVIMRVTSVYPLIHRFKTNTSAMLSHVSDAAMCHYDSVTTIDRERMPTVFVFASKKWNRFLFTLLCIPHKTFCPVLYFR